jgi:hypothetical protein
MQASEWIFVSQALAARSCDQVLQESGMGTAAMRGQMELGPGPPSTEADWTVVL